MRLTEFTQLEAQYVVSPNEPFEELVIRDVKCNVLKTFKFVFEQAKLCFKRVGLTVDFKVIEEDRAFYSKFAVDLFANFNDNIVEVGCINDRGNNDISNLLTVIQLSIGLDRILNILWKTD